jgi:hypothetical protein
MKLRPSKQKYMQSWSDSFLNDVNDYSQILGLVALLFTFIFGYFAYATAKESTRRSSDNEAIAERRADDLQKKADDAIRRAEQLEKQQAPRAISDEQINKFTQAVSGLNKGGIEVIIVAQDAETNQYADALRKMLGSAGFNVPDSVHVSVGSKYPVFGVTIVENVAPDSASPILFRDDLIESGIDCAIFHDDSLSVGAFKIVVGGK